MSSRALVCLSLSLSLQVRLSSAGCGVDYSGSAMSKLKGRLKQSQIRPSARLRLKGDRHLQGGHYVMRMYYSSA